MFLIPFFLISCKNATSILMQGNHCVFFIAVIPYLYTFFREEHNFRKRFLKYSLDHEHCHMTFYGPVVPARTGVIAFVNSTWRNQVGDYRLSCFLFDNEITVETPDYQSPMFLSLHCRLRAVWPRNSV